MSRRQNFTNRKCELHQIIAVCNRIHEVVILVKCDLLCRSLLVDFDYKRLIIIPIYSSQSAAETLFLENIVLTWRKWKTLETSFLYLWNFWSTKFFRNKKQSQSNLRSTFNLATNWWSDNHIFGKFHFDSETIQKRWQLQLSVLLLWACLSFLIIAYLHTASGLNES